MTDKQHWENKSTVSWFQKAEVCVLPTSIGLVRHAGLLDRTDSNSDTSLTILDNACGTGVITSLLQKESHLKDRCEITCADLSSAMVDAVKIRMVEESWKGVIAVVADAQDTKLPSNHFDYVLVNFGIFLLPDPQAGLKECYRMLKTGGTLSFSSIQHHDWYDRLSAAVERAGAPMPPPLEAIWEKTGAWHEPAFCIAQLEALNFVNVRSDTLDFVNGLSTVEDWMQLVEKQFPMITRSWDADMKESKTPLVLQEMRSGLEKEFGDQVKLSSVTLLTSGVKR